MQLQEFWQKTLTSGLSLKKALSPQSSPRSANFPSHKPDGGASQETFLPVFNTHASDVTGSVRSVPGDEVCLPHDRKTTHVATATLDPKYLYASAATQTDPSTRPMDEPTLTSDNRPDIEEDIIVHEQSMSLQNEGSPTHSEADTSSQTKSAEILKGQSQVVVTEFNGRPHLAILVTQGMIDDLNTMAEYNAKLDRLEGKLEAAKDKVALANIDVRYFEEAIEETDSQEKIDEFREKLERCQSTLPANTKRRDKLQTFADTYNIHIKCHANECLGTLQEVLTDGGVLQTHFERDQWEPRDEVEEKNGAEQIDGSSPGDAPFYYDDITISDASDISMEELHRRAVYEEVRQKYRAYCLAEHQYDNRHEEYAVQVARFRQQERDGECSITRTEFDRFDLDVTRELANDMAAAEEAYEDAVARRNKLGLVPGSDQESGFPTDEYDGYPLSWENEGIASAPTAFIDDWLQDIPEVENFPDITDLSQAGGYEFEPKDQQDMDDWDVRTAQLSDTWSCRDLTRNRRRIDRWNAVTGRER
ncbi:MAG: hypothetical protein L6R39_006473 [Caloplaca ligustica]|nr:MAG: hypothetical protein L6R39_006473 [Caloplaca ligustica]